MCPIFTSEIIGQFVGETILYFSSKISIKLFGTSKSFLSSLGASEFDKFYIHACLTKYTCSQAEDSPFLTTMSPKTGTPFCFKHGRLNIFKILDCGKLFPVQPALNLARKIDHTNFPLFFSVCLSFFAPLMYSYCERNGSSPIATHYSVL